MGPLAIVARHLGAYADLMSSVANEARRNGKRRVSWLAAALVLSISGLVAGWASLVILVWELPSRDSIALLAAAGLLSAGALCGWLASRAGASSPERARLMNELLMDRQILADWSQRQ
jgi:hypothetical protein